MAEPEDLVLTLLREMRARMDARFDAVNARFDAVDARFAEQDRKLGSIRDALKSETILGRYAVNGVDERLDDLEKRVTAIEANR